MRLMQLNNGPQAVGVEVRIKVSQWFYKSRFLMCVYYLSAAYADSKIREFINFLDFKEMDMMGLYIWNGCDHGWVLSRLSHARLTDVCLGRSIVHDGLMSKLKHISTTSSINYARRKYVIGKQHDAIAQILHSTSIIRATRGLQGCCIQLIIITSV